MYPTSLDLHKVERIEILPILHLRYSHIISILFTYAAYKYSTLNDGYKFEWPFWFLLASSLVCTYYSFTANYQLVIKKDNIYLIKYFPFYFKIQNFFPGNNKIIFFYKNFRLTTYTSNKNYIYEFYIVVNNKVYSFDFATYVMAVVLNDNKPYLNKNLVLNNPDHNQHLLHFLKVYYPQINVVEVKKSLGLWYKGKIVEDLNKESQ